MKRTTLFFIALSAVGAAHAQYGVTQIKNSVATSVFSGADSTLATSGSYGDFIGGIAYDSANDALYVSGWASSSTAKRQGIARLSTPTSGAATQSLTVSGSAWLNQTLMAGSSRSSKLQIANGNLYWGYGQGQSSTATNFGDAAAGPKFGFQKHSLAGNPTTGAGTQDLSFGGNGVVTPNEWRNESGTGITGNTRIDSFAFDSNTGTMIGAGFFNGFTYRVDASTGAYVAGGNAAFPGSIANGDNVGQYRDLAYDPVKKKLYTRSTISVSNPNTANRMSVESYDYDVATNTISNRKSLFLGNATADNSVAKVSFLSSTLTGDLLAVNDTSNGTIKVLNASTGVVLMSVNGAENGYTAFGATDFLTPHLAAGANGKIYLFVGRSNTGGTLDEVRTYQVVPEPATMAAHGLGVVAMLRRRKKS